MKCPPGKEYREAMEDYFLEKKPNPSSQRARPGFRETPEIKQRILSATGK
jgi:hypothetical protein